MGQKRQGAILGLSDKIQPLLLDEECKNRYSQVIVSCIEVDKRSLSEAKGLRAGTRLYKRALVREQLEQQEGGDNQVGNG